MITHNIVFKLISGMTHTNDNSVWFDDNHFIYTPVCVSQKYESQYLLFSPFSCWCHPSCFNYV